jgi:hypothetical protein
VNLTITLDEPLALRLQREAAARRLSPERTATELLGLMLDRLAREEARQRINSRRAELIRKARAVGLTADESRELAQLQAAIDQSLAPGDEQLLETAEEFRRLAERLPDATSP